MPKVTFYPYGNDVRGFAPVDPANHQKSSLYYCKEVFSHRLVGWRGGKGVDRSAKKTVKFLYRDLTPLTPEFVARKVATLHAFEQAMGFRPLAKCEVVVNRRLGWPDEQYLFFEVSEKWAASHPIAHILALLVRNHYPEGLPVVWPEIISWMVSKKKLTTAKEAVYEIIADKGKVRTDIPEVNGISLYSLARKRKLNGA